MQGLKRLLGCDVYSEDGRIGEVKDLLIDEATWTVVFMAVPSEGGISTQLLPMDCIRSSNVARRSIEVASRPGVPAQEQRAVSSVRSVREIIAYRINTLSGVCGICADLLAEVETWTVPYLVVNTQEQTPRRRVLVPSAWVRQIGRQEIQIDAQRRAIQRAQRFQPLSHDRWPSAAGALLVRAQ